MKATAVTEPGLNLAEHGIAIYRLLSIVATTGR